MGFVSLREGFDLAKPAGRLMAGVLARVAAYETEVRKERQLAGIAKAKAQGQGLRRAEAGDQGEADGGEGEARLGIVYVKLP